MASHEAIELEEVVSGAQTESPASEEELLKNLRAAITGKDEDSFHRHLSGLDKLLQDGNKMKELLDGSLAYAAYIGFQPALETLIQKGADVNAMSAVPEDPNTYKGTPLHWAARGGHVDTVTFFLEQGVDINIKNQQGCTPLYLAAERGHVDAVKCLAEQGADMNIKTTHGHTALQWAASRGHVDTVRYLVENGADMEVKSKTRWWTPLQFAACEDRVDTVRCLVDKGADLNIKDKFGMTPLHRAANSGHVDTVRCLLDKGAGINIKDEDGRTPLYLAAEKGHLDIVSSLVENKADTNIKGLFECTPLHLAAYRGFLDTVRLLVDKGADTTIKNEDGGTPLHLACSGGDVETVKYLLEEGADPIAKDKAGETPLSWAISSRHKDVAVLLLEHDKWKEMLKSFDYKSKTPMRGLIAFMPDVAEMAFSRCVTTNRGKDDWQHEEVHADSRNLEVMFNYEFLEDFQDEHSSGKQSSDEEGATNNDTSINSWQPKKFTKHSHPLFLIKKHSQSNLIRHPLVISLLDRKWKKFGRYIFFANLFIYLIFLVFLTAFGLVLLSPLERPCSEVLNVSFNGTAPEDCGDLTIDEYRFLFVGATFTIVTALLRLAIEVIQLCKHPLEYLQDWVNWLEIPLYLCSIVFTFVFATPCLCVYSWQWQIGVVSVFLGWIGLISFLQKWPVTGIYVLMFINIIQSFLKIAFLALLLVIAFALAFYMLFFEPDEMRNAFSHPGRAIVKVMTMTTGELDYDGIFHQQEGEEEIAFPPVSFILWVIFLVLIPVLLNNLLVGLAVGDVDRLQETATEKRIELQIDLVLTIEEMLEFMHLRHRFVIKESEPLYPNAVETLLPTCFKGSMANNILAEMAEDKYERPDKVRRWIAKRYAKWGISNDYSTSGVNICNQIEKLEIDLEAMLQQQSEKQKEQLEAKLQQQSEKQKEQLEAKLQQHFQEAIKHLTEEHVQKSEEQAKETRQFAGEVATLRELLQQQKQEQLDAKLQQHFQQAIKQLSEEQTQKSEEQTKEMREQAKKMEEQTAQLAGEVATLKEALQKLITKMDV